MSAVKAGHPELRKLMRQLPSGYHLQGVGGGGHAVLVGPAGPVRRASGQPLTLPSSPHRTSVDAVKRELRKLGLLR